MSYYELTIQSREYVRDRLIQKLMAAGSLGVIEQNNGITAYFAEAADMKKITEDLAILDMLLEKSGSGTLTFNNVLIPDQDWNESWKKGFQPLRIGERFTVLPPWEKEHEGRINLVIDPGMAFGTGHHATTRSCLVLMEKYCALSAKERFLDLGTGTGLLAIAAAKLGYKHVTALDTDPVAITAARMNAGLNNVPRIEIREGSIASISGVFDAIAANIISGVLLLLASQFAARLNTAGIVLLSGMLQGQEGEVIAEMKKNGLRMVERLVDDKWVSVVVRK